MLLVSFGSNSIIEKVQGLVIIKEIDASEVHKDVQVGKEKANLNLFSSFIYLKLNDIESLEHVGQEMKEHDEQIASATGPQLMR